MPLSLFSALLLILAFPYQRWVFLSVVGLIPLLLALRGQGWRRGLWLGGLHGLVFHGALMGWALYFDLLPYLFLACNKALLPALFGALWGGLSARRPQLLPFAFVSGWVFLEYLQTWGPFGATWGMLSHCWARQPLVLQSVSLLGPWVGSFLLVMLQATGYCWLRPECRGQRRVWSSLSVLLIGLNVIYGSWRLGQPAEEAEAVTVALAQVSMSREERWDPALAEESMGRLEAQTRQAAESGATLVVWPETAIPYRGFLADANLTYRVGLLARELGVWLIVGSIEKVGDEFQHTWNSASLVSPEGGYEGRYDKQRLVPGGEYLPLGAWMRRYRLFDRIMRYLPGQGSGVFQVPGLPLRPGLLICFESMVPYLAARRVAEGADVLLVPTNDAWLGQHPAIYHHFEMGVFRALEQGRPLLQCGNTGVSGWIDERGRILLETAIDVRATPVVRVWPLHLKTLYQQVGDLLAWMAGVSFLVSLILARGAIKWRKKGLGCTG